MEDLAVGFEYGLNAAATEFDGIHQYLRITDIDDATHEFMKNNITSPNANFDEVNDYLLHEGDIVFARTGASTGKTYRYKDSDGLTYFAGFLIRIKVKVGIDGAFVYQSTLLNEYNRYIKVASQRSGQLGVNSKEYAKYQLFVPQTNEQHQIGLFLSKIDDTVALHQRKHDLLLKLKKGYLQKLFPQNGEVEPELRFSGFTDAWEKRQFADIVNRVSQQDMSSTLPAVEYEDVVPDSGRLNKDVNSKNVLKKGIVFNNGDVLFGKLRPYLKNWLLADFSGVAVGDFWVLRPVRTNSHFLYYMIQSTTFQTVANQSSGTKMPRSDWKKVSKTVFQMPILKEQAAIGTFMNTIDATIALHQRKSSHSFVKLHLCSSIWIRPP
ncbi:MAG: restriction endonuclease subunit S [Lacticaseibacillus songhuajiangensis]|nr:restriction endonuclease subunit S [Lacticaseibacillus songhuajiangensis]